MIPHIFGKKSVSVHFSKNCLFKLEHFREDLYSGVLSHLFYTFSLI